MNVATFLRTWTTRMQVNMITILVRGWFRYDHSYGIVTTNLIRELRALNVEVVTQEMAIPCDTWIKTHPPDPNPLRPRHLPKIDLVYTQTYPHDVTIIKPGIPHLVFVTAEFGVLSSHAFRGDTLQPDITYTCPSHESILAVQKCIKGAPTLLVPHGVDQTVYWPMRTQTRELRILVIGAMTQNKGVQNMIPCISELVKRYPSAQFWFKCSDFLYTASANLLKLIDGTAFHINTDHLDEAAMRRLYNSCSIHVHLYLGEGFAMTPLEALACGTKIVVPALGSSTIYHQRVPSEANAVFETPCRAIPLENGGSYNEFKSDDIIATLVQAIESPPLNFELLRPTLDAFTWHQAAHRILNFLSSHRSSIVDYNETSRHFHQRQKTSCRHRRQVGQSSYQSTT